MNPNRYVILRLIDRTGYFLYGHPLHRYAEENSVYSGFLYECVLVICVIQKQLLN